MEARQGINALLVLEGNKGVSTATLSDDVVEQAAGDRGGRTKWGVTQATYDTFRSACGQPKRLVDYMVPEEMYQIYEIEYWIPSGGGRLPDGLDYVVFQAAVNCGVATAIIMLQEIVGTKQDGQLGPQTLAAVATWDKAALIKAYLDRQKVYYDAIVASDSGQLVNLQGWYNRITKVAAFLIKNKTAVGLTLVVVLAAILAVKNSNE